MPILCANYDNEGAVTLFSWPTFTQQLRALPHCKNKTFNTCDAATMRMV